MSRLAGHKKTSARTHVLIDVTSCVISYFRNRNKIGRVKTSRTSSTMMRITAFLATAVVVQASDFYWKHDSEW